MNTDPERMVTAMETISAPAPAPTLPETTVYPVPVQPAAVRPPRRIGTFTLGLTLILLGVLVPICLFFGGRTWRLLQFAPAVLLCLGIETLVFAIWHKTEKFRYDGLSVFLVIAITFTTLIASAIVPVATNLAAFATKEREVTGSVEKTCRDALIDNRLSGQVSANVVNRSADWVYAFRTVEETENWNAVATISLDRLDTGSSPSREVVADAFTKLAKSAGANSALDRLYLNFSAQGETAYTYYTAVLSQNSLKTLQPEDMLQIMTVSDSPIYY